MPLALLAVLLLGLALGCCQLRVMEPERKTRAVCDGHAKCDGFDAPLRDRVLLSGRPVRAHAGTYGNSTV